MLIDSVCASCEMGCGKQGDGAVQFDLDPYDTLVFHARGDGQAFIASVSTFETVACCWYLLWQ